MRLFTSVYYDCARLPKFLEHYASLGVTNFVVLVNAAGKRDLQERVAHSCSGYSTDVEALDAEGFDVTQTYQALDRLRTKMLTCEDEWIVVADLDEFLELPCGLPELVQRCEVEDSDYVRGKLVDRLAADGRFPKLTDQPLAVQFPVAAELTKNILHGCVDKVPLMRASCPIVPGLHSTQGRALRDVCLNVHHYKWSDGVVERMYDRLFMYLKYKSPFWSEPDAFLRRVGRDPCIDLKDPLLNARPDSEGR